MRDAPYALRTEAGPDAEGLARAERGADYRRVGVLEVLHVRQAGEGTHPEKRGLSKEFAGSYLTILPPPTFHLQEAFP